MIGTLTRIAEHLDEQRHLAAESFALLVDALSAGEEVAAPEVAKVLAEVGKSFQDLEAAVDRASDRREAAELLADLPNREKTARAAEAAVARLERQRDEEIKAMNAEIAAAKRTAKHLRESVAECGSARRTLLATASPDLKQRQQQLEAEIGSLSSAERKAQDKVSTYTGLLEDLAEVGNEPKVMGDGDVWGRNSWAEWDHRRKEREALSHRLDQAREQLEDLARRRASAEAELARILEEMLTP